MRSLAGSAADVGILTATFGAEKTTSLIVRGTLVGALRARPPDREPLSQQTATMPAQTGRKHHGNY